MIPIIFALSPKINPPLLPLHLPNPIIFKISAPGRGSWTGLGKRQFTFDFAGSVFLNSTQGREGWSWHSKGEKKRIFFSFTFWDKWFALSISNSQCPPHFANSICDQNSSTFICHPLRHHRNRRPRPRPRLRHRDRLHARLRRLRFRSRPGNGPASGPRA